MPYIEPNLVDFENRVFSQFGEDGVIEKISSCLGIADGTFFEFGIGYSGHIPGDETLEGNFVLLRQKGWRGVFLDGRAYPRSTGIRNEFITALNINALYKKHGLPDDLDFMSIDVDGQEFWIWMALDFKPKVMIVEYNGGIPKDESRVIKFDLEHIWDQTVYHGSSLKALNKLAISKGYVLVWSNGVNAAFIRADLVSNPADFTFDRIFRSYPAHADDTSNRDWVKV